MKPIPSTTFLIIRKILSIMNVSISILLQYPTTLRCPVKFAHFPLRCMLPEPGTFISRLSTFNHNQNLPPEPTMASETVKLASSDGKEFEVQKKDFQKANLLKTMMADLGFDEDALPEEAIPMPSVNADALETIVDWLRMHEEEEPRSEDDRQIHRFNRNVSKEDTELLDKQFPRSRLAAVINAAYYLEMPDLIDTLVKYTANNLEGKTAEEMSQWLEIPLKKDERKNAAGDQGADEGESSEKRERTGGGN
ncbi:hypothetical protein QR680_006276 [Steinernema hermaphroditum]|uniref:SKP1 component POZ domain-containing protein n=1 Tax=Steinernema hermaphroditum TaxID=289476 RepID=A0AA39HUZ9_9BILA|nr:hypothetical protein QR680_006276 [Steinernema hermaphroditum]